MFRLWVFACALLLAGVIAIDCRPALAQGPGLGGYGASASMMSSGTGASGPIIPYGGSLSGFMPYRMPAAGNGLSFSSAKPLGHRVRPRLVPPVLDESRDDEASSGTRGRFTAWPERAAALARSRRWDGTDDEAWQRRALFPRTSAIRSISRQA